MYTYLGEYVSNDRRPAMLAWVTTSVGIATIIMPCKWSHIFGNHISPLFIQIVLAFWILSYDWSFELYSGFSFKPWRLLLLTYTIPGIIGALILLSLRPSPKFLLSIKREKEALAVVKWMYQENKGKCDAKFNIGRIISEESDVVKGR